jgi:hypothetical protein
MGKREKEPNGGCESDHELVDEWRPKHDMIMMALVHLLLCDCAGLHRGTAPGIDPSQGLWPSRLFEQHLIFIFTFDRWGTEIVTEDRKSRVN